MESGWRREWRRIPLLSCGGGREEVAAGCKIRSRTSLNRLGEDERSCCWCFRASFLVGLWREGERRGRRKEWMRKGRWERSKTRRSKRRVGDVGAVGSGSEFGRVGGTAGRLG